MPLTAGSNHGASRADSDLFVGLTRELLQRGCHVRFRAIGTSMHPAIRDGEVVTVAPLSGDAFAVGDVVLCRVGRCPTAHRVMAVQPTNDGRPVLHLHGDNLCSPDRPVRAEDVIGRVLTVSRDGREQPLDGPGRRVRLRWIARWLFAATIALATVMGASDALAQIGGQRLTWVGGVNTNWSTRQNWLPEEIPARGADLVFPASGLFLTSINDLANVSVNSITIRGGYTISGLAVEITGDPGLLVEGAVTVTIGMNLTLNRDPIHVATNGGTLELSGRVTSRNFVKQGAGTLVLSGANDITDLVGESGCGVIRATNPQALGNSLVGRIQLDQGCTLQVEASTTLDKPITLNGRGAPGTTGVLVVAEGVTLTERVNLNMSSAATISVLSGATLDLPDALTLTLNVPLTLNVAGLAAARISRLITGTGDITKVGAGSLFLNKNNTFRETVIQGGTVFIDGNQPTSAVLLDGGTVAGGIQDFSIGTISATAAGGTISVGRGGSEVMGSRSVTLNAASTFEVEFNGNQFDKLIVSGTVALNGAVLSVLGQFPPNQAVTVLDNDSNDAVIGTFAGLSENARVTLAGFPMRISYKGGTGNDIVLTPEVLAVEGSEVLTGTYVGNGVDNRQITGLGFRPDLVIIKAATAQAAVGRTSTMTGDASKNMATGAIVANRIQSLNPTGFTVGSNAQVNSAGTTYHWVAWKGAPGEMTVGTYTGNGSAFRQITGLGFSPDIVFVISAGSDQPVHRVSAGPLTNAFTFSGTLSTGYIPLLLGDGFIVGSDPRVNQTGTTYHYVAWDEIPGRVDVGTYNGNGTDNRNIAGVGFQPDFLMAQSNNTVRTVAHSMAMGPSTDSSHFFNASADVNNRIQVLQPAGFQVGSAAESNANGAAFTYAAWGRVAPTAVRMAAMTARRTEKGVVLEWRTGLEVDNLGFHVYRGSANNRVRLTTTLVAGSGLQLSPGIAMGVDHSYHWNDETAGARAADVPYWVEEISLSGERTMHGPVMPETGAAGYLASTSGTPPPSPRLGALTDGRPASAARAPIAPEVSLPEPAWALDANPLRAQSTATMLTPSSLVVSAATVPAVLRRQWAIAARPAVKVDIAAAGWYRVGQPALVAAGLAPTVDPSLLQLFVDGVQQRLRVNGTEDGRFDPQDSVEFYATGADTPYTGIRTYWILVGDSAGRRVPVVDGRSQGQGGATSFPFSVELKPRTIYFGALSNGEKENFFGPLIMPGESTQQVADLPDVLPRPQARAEIEVALQGVTDVGHRVGVRVNGVEVGEVTFANRDHIVRTFAIAQALLADGANTITLDARGDETDYSLLDSVRFTYHRRYQAGSNTLTFSADAGDRVTVTGFGAAGIRVFDITNGVATREVLGNVTRDRPGWKVAFGVPGNGRRTLIAVASDAVASPVSLRANVPSNLHGAGQAGEIVMIAPAAFRSALVPLKLFRESQGHTVRIVDIEDIYDEFSFGEKTPQAIHDFMVRASGQWSAPPRFLLLAGNATQDPRDYYGIGEVDYVPVRVVPTGAMDAASDDWFVDSDDDGFADLAVVGRLPARSAVQLAAMVAKIIAYEQSNDDGAWQRSVVMVSDRDPAGLVDYAALNERALAMLPDNYQVTLIRRGLDPDAGQLVKARLGEGAAIVSYSGHGSVASWELDLLTADDVPRLTNGTRLPLVIALDCFNGFFQSLFPEESLAEALVRAPGGGAIGVWASSGMTSPPWQATLNRELYRQLFQVGWRSIGEAMRAAKQVIGDPDVRRTWIYFGDPVTRLRGLPDPPASTITRSTPQGPLAVPGTGDTADSGSGTGAAASQQHALRLADMDGDGRDDPFVADAQSGSWFSARGRGALPQVRGQGVEPIAVDLNGDGRSDLFAYDASTGEWLEAMSLKDGRFITYNGSWTPGYRISEGDFDGDGRDEVFGMSGATGAWFQASADGRGGFTYRSGVGLHDGAIRVADFDGDSRDDVFVYDASTGRWTLMLSTAKGATFERGRWSAGWDVTVARLNTDRQADLFLWDATSGTWSGCIRGKASFACSSGKWPVGGRIQPLDRDGDGRDELLRYDARTGSWTLIEMSPAGKVSQAEGMWEPGWSVASGDLDGDGRDDLVLYNAETGELIKRLSRGAKWKDEAPEAWPAGWLMVGRRP